jgi:hypothetical protein
VQVTREKRAKNKQTRVHRCLVRMGPRARGTSPSLSASVLRDFREHSANTATTIANPHLASTGYVSSRKTDISASASQMKPYSKHTYFRHELAQKIKSLLLNN